MSEVGRKRREARNQRLAVMAITARLLSLPMASFTVKKPGTGTLRTARWILDKELSGKNK